MAKSNVKKSGKKVEKAESYIMISIKNILWFIFKSPFLITIVNYICAYILMDKLFIFAINKTELLISPNISKYIFYILLFLCCVAFKFESYGNKYVNLKEENVGTTFLMQVENFFDKFMNTLLTLIMILGMSLLSGIFFIFPFFYCFPKYIISLFYVSSRKPVEHSDFKTYFCTNTFDKINSILSGKRLKVLSLNNLMLIVSIIVFFLIPNNIIIKNFDITPFLKHFSLDIFIIHIIGFSYYLDDAEEKFLEKQENAEKKVSITISKQQTKAKKFAKDAAVVVKYFDPQIDYERKKLK